MKHILWILFITLSLNVYAQANLKKVDQYLEQARIDWGVPGMSVAIVKDNEIVLNKGYGHTRINDGKPINEHTLFAIASNTKAFIASVLATLVQEGKINWKDKVTDYLPYFELYDAYSTSEATIEDLLCHRLGLGTFSGDVIWYKSELTAKEVVERVKYVPQAYSFRDGYGYSNLMFITAGEVIKAVTGQSWAEYVQETFFSPLKMNRTITSTDDLSKLGNAATPHKPVGEQNIPIEWTNWDNMGAAGGIISSSSDMAKWIQLNLNRGIYGADTILSPDQQNLLWTPHNSFIISDESNNWIPGRNFNGYGLGWGLYDYFGRKVVTHSGGYDGMYSRVVLVPSEKLGFVILTNSMTGIINPLMMYLINSYIQEDQQDWSTKYLERPGSGGISKMVAERKNKRVKNTKPSLPLEAYANSYFDPMYGEIEVALENNELKLKFANAPLLNASLKHWHKDTWEIKWDQVHAWFDFGTIQFIMDNNMGIKGIEFDVPNYDIFFDEIHAKKSDK